MPSAFRSLEIVESVAILDVNLHAGAASCSPTTGAGTLMLR